MCIHTDYMEKNRMIFVVVIKTCSITITGNTVVQGQVVKEGNELTNINNMVYVNVI